LISTAKLHSVYVKESESGDGVEILERSQCEIEVGNFGKIGVGYFTFDSATLLQIDELSDVQCSSI